MSNVINFTILINVVLIVMFTLCCCLFANKNIKPKLRANLATVTFFVQGTYMLLLFIIAVLGVLNNNYICLSALFFIALPFILGHFVTFKTLKFYSGLQIFAFCLTLAMLIFA